MSQAPLEQSPSASEPQLGAASQMHDSATVARPDVGRCWELTRDEWKLLGTVSLLSLLAKGTAIFGRGYSTDDYYLALSRMSGDAVLREGALAQGRWVELLVYQATSLCGAHAVLAASVYAGLLLLVTVWLGLVIRRLWRAPEGLAAGIVAVSFVCLHPYQAECWTFRGAWLVVALSLLLGFVGLAVCGRRRKSFVLACICTIAALATYQTVLHYLAVTLLLLGLLRWLGGGAASKSLPWREALLGREYAACWLMLAVSAAGYYGLTRMILTLSGISMADRGEILPVSQWPERMGLVAGLLKLMLIKDEPVLPAAVKGLLWLVLAGGLMAILKRSSAGGPRWRAIAGTGAALGVLGLALLAVVGLAAILRFWWPTPRVLSAAGIFWAGVFCIACAGLDGMARRTIIGVGLLLVMLFAANTNRVLVDQQRVNVRDQLLASRIIARLEARPDFANVKRVAVVGGLPQDSLPVTAGNDLNVSAFSKPWSRVTLLREISGYTFGEPTAADLATAERYDQAAPRWPHPDSVTVSGDLAIVCLPR